MTPRLRRLRLLEAIEGRLDPGLLTADERRTLFDAAGPEGVQGLVASLHPELGELPAASRASAVLASHMTARAVALLSDAGIGCVVLKGVAIAAMAWERPALRPQWDVDLLVRPVDVPGAVRALRDGGLAGRTKLAGRHWHHVVLFSAAPPGGIFEVHRELTVDLPVGVAVEDLLSRRIHVSTPDGDLPTLAHEDAIVYLGLHAAIHAMERLQWSIDLAGYARRQPIDWDVAIGRARAWGVALPVGIAWSEAARLVGAAIPDGVVERLGVSRVRGALSRTLLAGALRSDGAVRHALQRAFRLSMVPTPSALVRTLRRKLSARQEGRASPTGA